MRAEQIKFVSKLGTLVEDAAERLQNLMLEHHIPTDGYKLFGKPVSLARLSFEVRKMQNKGFSVIGHGFEFVCGSVGNARLDFLEIKSAGVTVISWDEWAAQFFGNPNFVMAWLADSEYQHWQNAKDPLQYTAVGKSYEHLPMKSNGLPFPLEQQIIDTSDNPGRWSFHQGYLEAVGAVMWLGKPFWKLTGAQGAKIENAEWLHVSKPIPSVIRVQAAAKCFTTPLGKSGEFQRKLRSLLFPRTSGVPLER